MSALYPASQQAAAGTLPAKMGEGICPLCPPLATPLDGVRLKAFFPQIYLVFRFSTAKQLAICSSRTCTRVIIHSVYTTCIPLASDFLYLSVVRISTLYMYNLSRVSPAALSVQTLMVLLTLSMHVRQGYSILSLSMCLSSLQCQPRKLVPRIALTSQVSAALQGFSTDGFH